MSLFVFFFRRSLSQEMSRLSDWLTAACLFATACFIIGWPLRDSLAVTAQVGPAAIWALIVLTQFMVMSKYWDHDLRGQTISVLCGGLQANHSSRLGQYSFAKVLAGICVGAAYAAVGILIGSVLFALSSDQVRVLIASAMILSPAVSALAIATSALVTQSTGNQSVLGVVLMAPLLAPLVIFTGIYTSQVDLHATMAVGSLSALIGLSVLYAFASIIAAPAILRAQL